MMQNKKLVGITGGSGCGKSYLSMLLRRRGIPVIDCDLVSREIMGKDTPCAKEVVRCFGDEILENGELSVYPAASKRETARYTLTLESPVFSDISVIFTPQAPSSLTALRYLNPAAVIIPPTSEIPTIIDFS